jgi:azurin
MKTLFVFVTSLAITLFISCGGPSTENKTATDTSTSSASNMMKESTYDPGKIDPAAPVTEVTLHATGNTMDQMKYDMSEIRVKANSTVKLTLINQAKDSAMQHNFVLIDDGTAEKVATEGLKAGADANYVPKLSSVYVNTKLTMPGETTSISFPAPDKGTYEFVCTYPGHWQKMRGKFIVE